MLGVNNSTPCGILKARTMGRGLSELQKNILVIGHRKRGAGDDPHDDELDSGKRLDATFWDVLTGHFGWGFDETHDGDAVDEDRRAYFAIRPWTEVPKHATITTILGDNLKTIQVYRVENYNERRVEFNRWKRRKSARFSRKVAGVKRYQAAMASICRAMQRLHDRGFVTYRKQENDGSGCKLTPWGMYQAYRLTTGRMVSKLTVSRPSPINPPTIDTPTLAELERRIRTLSIG